LKPINKRPLATHGQPQQLKQPIRPAQQFKPVVAQLKNAVSAQSVKRPIAPPVYCPQAMPSAAQPKMANGAMNRKPPVTPPVYRPQQVPKVLQTKSSLAQSPHAGQAPRQPAAPPVYRPEAKKLSQPNAPQAHRPEQKRIAQPKMATAAPVPTRPNAPPANSRSRPPVSPEPPRLARAGQRPQATIQRSKTAKSKESSQSTQVILWFGQFEVHGSTGKDAGHAEMDAINQFIIACINEKLDPVEEYKDRKAKLRVKCEAKPVCVRCSCVLKALGFEPKNGNTEWGSETMGSTEWEVTQAVKDFLAETAPGAYEKAKKY
jgi:hypothetical protein